MIGPPESLASRAKATQRVKVVSQLGPRVCDPQRPGEPLALIKSGAFTRAAVHRRAPFAKDLGGRMASRREVIAQVKNVEFMKTIQIVRASAGRVLTTLLFAIATTVLAADPCVVAPNANGVVVLPPVGCEYLCPDDVHRIVDGLPTGTTIELSPFHRNFICSQDTGGRTCTNDCFIDANLDPDCDPANGTEELFLSEVRFKLKGTGLLAGWERDLTIPNLMCRVQSGPRPAGSPSTFPTLMRQLQGQIVGDPDFDLLRVTAGSDFGLPSPGQTTLTQLPGGNWMVDSFFDITYRIDFIGASGGHLAGASGSTTATIHMVSAAPTVATIPTLSEWGLIILTLSLLTVCTLWIRRQRLVAAGPAAA